MNLIRPSIFPDGVTAALSTRNGGVSPAPLGMNLSFMVGDDPGNVRKNREYFLGGLGIGAGRLALPAQVHGTTVLNAGSPGEYPDADGLTTNVPEVFVGVSIADCVPVLMCDPVRRAVAAVHAGWRGTASGIAGSAVRTMTDLFGTRPGDLLAFIGPAAGACCYEVGEEVASRFPPAFLRREQGRVYLGLKEVNRAQLLYAGIASHNIEISPHCTISDSSLFHSHRRDGSKAGRMMGVIGLKS